MGTGEHDIVFPICVHRNVSKNMDKKSIFSSIVHFVSNIYQVNIAKEIHDVSSVYLNVYGFEINIVLYTYRVGLQ